MAMLLNSEIQNFKQLKQILPGLWVPEVVDFKELHAIQSLWEENHILSLISVQKHSGLEFKMEQAPI